MQTPTKHDRGAASGSPMQAEAGRAPYRVGDLIELWSKSQQAWCRGSIDKVEGSWVHIAYAGPEGQPMTKIMPNGHEELRAPGAGLVQGNENANLQNMPVARGQSSGKPVEYYSPCPAPPPPPPHTQSPARSPLHALQTQSPEPPVVIAAPASAMEPGPMGALFSLPALGIGDILKPGTGPAPISPSPPVDIFGHLDGGMDLLGSMRVQRQQKFAAPSTPQGYHGGMGLTPNKTSPGWQGQSPSQHSHSLSMSPGGAAGQTPPRKNYTEPEICNKVPLVAGVERVEPEAVHQMLQTNACVLVDLRGDDRAIGLIPGSTHVQAIDSIPFMQKIPGMMQSFKNHSLVVFTCQYSAHRAPQCANWYREAADPRQRVAIMSGGFRAWEGIGLPVESSGSGDKYAADAYALLQGVQFTHKQPGGGGQALSQDRAGKAGRSSGWV